jgi:hypothetical protein
MGLSFRGIWTGLGTGVLVIIACWPLSWIDWGLSCLTPHEVEHVAPEIVVFFEGSP